MKLNLCTIALALSLPLAAHAGKAERDFQSGTVDPAVKEAINALKKNCGADVKFDIKTDTFKSTDEMFQIKHFADSLTNNSAKYCSDAPSKAAIGKLKSIEYSRAGESAVKFSGGKASVTTDGSSNATWDMLAKEVDK